ncbi:type II toxin-antitoxin system ParD family antitoxin [uncultured Sphingomonas sp.]|uniref:ribbon-helix-helix domain-containing protein n=1 Tax=uncultured Sphingomonas sp. TaxID=158754 RepID=UPI0025E65A33|nr:type II toxin-antitoxin system ParD family antitoxin [uncultured Sphingomonas sp.]
MTVRKNIWISLSPELHAVAEGLLASDRYANFGEVVRAALRLLDEREQAFERHNTVRQTAAVPQAWPYPGHRRGCRPDRRLPHRHR